MMGLLPQLTAPLTLTDGGLETTLIFHDGIDLPDFAAFTLLDDRDGRDALDRYTAAYVAVAERHRVPLVVETATWRASQDWGDRLGIDAASMADLNRRAVRAVAAHRLGHDHVDLVVSGCVGPRGDGYVVDGAMTPDEAAAYHRPQIESLRDGGADLVTAITMTYADEAAGIARAALGAGIPCVISFTTETDGRLPSGETLAGAIGHVDRLTEGAPMYYMVNCAHPSHFDDVLQAAPWMERLRGVRANASTRSHDELDNAEDLDAGDPEDLARRYLALRNRFPRLTIFGGCCGTDVRHIEATAAALAS